MDGLVADFPQRFERALDLIGMPRLDVLQSLDPDVVQRNRCPSDILRPQNLGTGMRRPTDPEDCLLQFVETEGFVVAK